jgi:cell division protein ZapA
MTNHNGRISLGKGNMDTTSTPTIRVEIYNQTYNIRSDGDSEYITQLAEFVDNRMREISSGTLTVDSLKVAILAALHIADELHRLKRLHDQADAQLASRSAECAEMLDRLLKVRSTVEQQQNAPTGNIAFT